ncbi:unnamed protein product [Calypogeia fissa]
MDLGQIVDNYNESSTDLSERSINAREGWSGVRGGDSSKEQSQGTKGEKHFDHSHDSSGLEQQDAHQHISHEGASNGSNETNIESMEELSNAMKLSNLSQVKFITLREQDIGRGHFTLAEALASGHMATLKRLWLAHTGLEGDQSKALCNALSSGKFPSLTSIDFRQNRIGSQGIEALGRAIQSRILEKLEVLLYDTGINDQDMATLATALQHGEDTPMPNLSDLFLSSNPFKDVGLQSLAEALKLVDLNH